MRKFVNSIYGHVVTSTGKHDILSNVRHNEFNFNLTSQDQLITQNSSIVAKQLIVKPQRINYAAYDHAGDATKKIYEQLSHSIFITLNHVKCLVFKSIYLFNFAYRRSDTFVTSSADDGKRMTCSVTVPGMTSLMTETTVEVNCKHIQ